MDTYLTLLYVTLEQEMALKDFFIERGWTYCKPDLGVMTDRVGPFESPQTVVTNTGSIIMYSQQSGRRNSSVKTKMKRSVKRAPASKEDPQVKVEVVHEEDLSSQLFNTVCVENTDGSKHSENYNDDGDYDFADDHDTSVEDKENDQIIMEHAASASKRGRKPVRRSGKHTAAENVETSDKTTAVGNNSTGQGKAVASKKRKVAADGDDKTEAITADKQQGKATWTPVVVMKDVIKQLTQPQRTKRTIRLKCSQCPKEYKLQFQLNRHFKKEHEAVIAPKKKPSKKKPPCRQCDICGSVFSRSDILYDHKRRIHKGIRKVKPQQISTCEICGLSFKRASHLKEHVLSKHSSNPLPHACTLCEKSFLRHRFLELHINRDHLKVKPFACSYCNKQFFAQHSAQNHIKQRVCQPDRERNYKCIKCDKRFPRAHDLEMHMTAVHFGGAFTCICGEVVKWEGSVPKHKRQCKRYQEYVALNGEEDSKICNIIEIQYNNVVSENEEPTADEDHNTDSTEDVIIDKTETEPTLEPQESS